MRYIKVFVWPILITLVVITVVWFFVGEGKQPEQLARNAFFNTSGLCVDETMRYAITADGEIIRYTMVCQMKVEP